VEIIYSKQTLYRDSSDNTFNQIARSFETIRINS